MKNITISQPSSQGLPIYVQQTAQPQPAASHLQGLPSNLYISPQNPQYTIRGNQFNKGQSTGIPVSNDMQRYNYNITHSASLPYASFEGGLNGMPVVVPSYSGGWRLPNMAKKLSIAPIQHLHPLQQILPI